MTPTEAIRGLEVGTFVECTADEYPAIRKAIQQWSGERILKREFVRANTGINEVRRLDKAHNFDPGKLPAYTPPTRRRRS